MTALVLPYLQAYPAALQQQVAALIQKPLGVEQWLSARYSQPHNTRSDKAPYAYTDALKAENLRKAGSLHRVSYDNKIHVVRNALGLHTRTAVVHGRWLNVRHEISYCSHVQIFARAVLENDRDP
ncbi:hypothetical protein [Comamonas sp.]|uniref:hypothetical protein n=1 Tax=Comamonas sp. TaxID=34028 RepID=UPI00289A7240|nr:hypothetical protein [Comamonas sp.]